MVSAPPRVHREHRRIRSLNLGALPVGAASGVAWSAAMPIDPATQATVAHPDMGGGWYASEPAILGDRTARNALTTWARMRQSTTAEATALALEAHVVADPIAAFGFADDGTATLEHGGRTYAAGRFATPTIAELRTRLPAAATSPAHRARLSVLYGSDALTDISTLQATAPDGVLFQVASQFNCLEAPSASIVPVAEYVYDATQGPRASISALAGTLLRHHAAPAPGGGRFTQTDARCLNLLGEVLDPAVAEVRSGYLSSDFIRDVPATATALTNGFERIRIGLHDDVEVMFGHDWNGVVARPGARIAQVLTSTIALGGYGRDDGSTALAEVCLQLQRAAYVGTLLGAVALGKHTVVLTLIGGGVFGNPHRVIWDAIHFALAEVDRYLTAPLHVIVNTRNTLADADAAKARARGGFVTSF